jgi:hypothetical protein
MIFSANVENNIYNEIDLFWMVLPGGQSLKAERKVMERSCRKRRA